MQKERCRSDRTHFRKENCEPSQLIINSKICHYFPINFVAFIRQKKWATKSTDVHLNLSICLFKDIKPSEWIKIKKREREFLEIRLTVRSLSGKFTGFEFFSQILRKVILIFCQRKMDDWMARSTVLIWKNTQRQKY